MVDIATIKEYVTENSRDITKIKGDVWGNSAAVGFFRHCPKGDKR